MAPPHGHGCRQGDLQGTGGNSRMRECPGTQPRADPLCRPPRGEGQGGGALVCLGPQHGLLLAARSRVAGYPPGSQPEPGTSRLPSRQPNRMQAGTRTRSRPTPAHPCPHRLVSEAFHFQPLIMCRAVGARDGFILAVLPRMRQAESNDRHPRSAETKRPVLPKSITLGPQCLPAALVRRTAVVMSANGHEAASLRPARPRSAWSRRSTAARRSAGKIDAGRSGCAPRCRGTPRRRPLALGRGSPRPTLR